jgi:hypothetical protein
VNSLLHLGRPLSEFILSTQPSQGSQPNTLVTPVTPAGGKTCGDVQGNTQPCLVDVSLSPSTGRTTNLASVGTNCSFVVDPVLSFIKAFRLKGDSDSLRRVVTASVVGLWKLLSGYFGTHAVSHLRWLIYPSRYVGTLRIVLNSQPIWMIWL